MKNTSGSPSFLNLVFAKFSEAAHLSSKFSHKNISWCFLLFQVSVARVSMWRQSRLKMSTNVYLHAKRMKNASGSPSFINLVFAKFSEAAHLSS
jgi:hypothetical protein